MGCPPTVTGVLAVVFIFISSVFFLLILSPVPADVISRRVVLSCSCLRLCDRSTRSSAKSRSSNCVQSVHCIPLFPPVVVVFMSQSMTGGRGTVKAGTPPISSLHLETFRQLAGADNSSAHVLKGAPDEGNYLFGTP